MGTDRSSTDVVEWHFELARSDLLDRERQVLQGGAKLPSSLGRFISRSQRASAVTAAEELVEKVLMDAGAICTDARPYVRLSRVAKLLGARIRFSSPPQKSLLGRNASAQWRRTARLVRDEAGWVIFAGDKDSAFTRETVAHELGHALLYKDEGGIDIRAWREARWSAAEESLCNYLGRLILAPADLINMRSAVNMSTHLVAEVAGRLDIPIKVAALRWLDLVDLIDSRAQAIIFWRQYHPFEHNLLAVAFRSYPTLYRNLRAILPELSRLFPNISFVQAIELWREILGLPSGEGNLLPLRTTEQDFAVEQFRRKLVLSGIDDQAALSFDLSTPRAPSYYRPEWILWRGRPKHAFVPVRRGSAKRESVVARVASGDLDECTGSEFVKIGDLRGEYEVHAFGHGNPDDGSRYVLQSLIGK